MPENGKPSVHEFVSDYLGQTLNLVAFLVTFAILLPSVAFGQSGGIDARCNEKWEDKSQMQRHCRDKQTEPKRWVHRFDENHQDPTSMTILKNCKDKWSDSHGHNWPMVKHCTEQQTEAAKKVEDSNEDDSTSKIASRCRQKWEDNFQMQKHCQDQQKDAKNWVHERFNSNDSSAKRALLTRCKSKWNDGPGHNWKMVKHCIEQQQ